MQTLLIVFYLMAFRCSSDRTSSSSSSDNSEQRNPRSSYRHRGRNTDQYVQFIQSILLQVSINIEKYTRYYTEELKNSLVNGVSTANKATSAKVLEEINKLEQRINKVIEHYNEEILRETDDLITNTNQDLQDSVLALIKKTNEALVTSLQAKSVVLPAPAATPNIVGIEINTAIDLVNTAFIGLLEQLAQLFKRVTGLEKAQVTKIIEDRLNWQLVAIQKLLNDFESKTSAYFKELGVETNQIVQNSVTKATQKFVLYIDGVLKKVGYSIMAVLKGCNANYRPPVRVNPSALLCNEFEQVNIFE